MPEDRVIPTPAPGDLPTFSILIDGNEIKTSYQVMSVDVSKVYNKIASAKVILLDGDPAAEDFKISNSDDFKPGNEIEIKAGYHSNEATIFKGIIIKHGIKVRKSKSSHLIIEAKDKAVKSTIGRKSRYFYESTDSEIIEEIAGNYGLSIDIESTTVSHKESVQHYATDWDFIISRVEINGMFVFTDDNKLVVTKPKNDSDPVLTLGHGSTLVEFEAEMDSRSQFATVKSYSWDYTGQELIESEAEAPSYTESGDISSSDLADVIGLDEYKLKHSGKVSESELQEWANAQALRSVLSKIRGRARFKGNSDVKPGKTVMLNGVGNRFNGKVLVTGVRHQIDTQNWETDIQFGYSPQWFYKTDNVLEKPASGLIPGINGLQIGTVVSLEGDPDGEDRIQVKIPIVDNEGEGVWARISTLDAGDSRGSFFRPEIGDEVVMGFMNDDPRDAVILGMLNSSSKPAPLQASDDNNEKGFVTRSEIKLLFDDDKKSVTVETPNGNKLILSDDEGSIKIEDENGNKIEMSSNGISIESIADITIKASGDVTIEGTNVSNKANAQFKAEGSAGAEMSTSAAAVVKGSVVQINQVNGRKITMPPAARVGDLSTHGGTVTGPGVPTVLIGGMPAAVMLDMHVCPLPPVAHQPTVSPFTIGSATVLIGGKPALRVGDVCACGASPAIGTPTVLIG